MNDKNTTTDEVFVCEKCKKTKKRSEGSFVLEGTTFCCKTCCGDPKDAKSKESATNVCEFC